MFKTSHGFRSLGKLLFNDQIPATLRKPTETLASLFSWVFFFWTMYPRVAPAYAALSWAIQM